MRNACSGLAANYYQDFFRHYGLLVIEFVRSGSDGIRLEMQLDNETEWKPAGTFVKSPANLAIDAKSDGLPRAVRLRARFLDGNNPVGQFSDTVNLVTVP